MKAKWKPIVSDGVAADAEPWPFWGPALMLASCGAWTLLLGAARLAALLL